ncbi:MAG: hypothetical protein MK515_06595 [SAR324 cluster bacterium]|jgi:hypothetical protein|nr:hypothetical protein [SAR324 cluster bacterium]|tara:strand:- start:371 stop:730 length:360 start_codon:yes stop_codon:yes gene_type:complete
MMETLNILLIGAGTGVVLAIVSMLLINAENSEQYPLGGFLPALWMVTDLGVDSRIMVAGILMMGGMTGFYLTLTFWKERPAVLKDNSAPATHSAHDSNAITDDEHQTITVSGKSLAEFL